MIRTRLRKLEIEMADDDPSVDYVWVDDWDKHEREVAASDRAPGRRIVYVGWARTPEEAIPDPSKAARKPRDR